MSNWQNWAAANALLESAHKQIAESRPLCADASHSLVFDISEAADLINRVRSGLTRQIARARYEPGDGISQHG